jgi:hypothetical protein
MGCDGHWNFYQVPDKIFPAINFDFIAARNGIQTTFDERSYIEIPEENIKNGVLTLLDNRGVFFHPPFADLDYQVNQKDNWQHLNLQKSAYQSRVLPTAVLFNSIGRERFFQLPGYLGNMLIHSTDIDVLTFQVSQILDLDRELYFHKAKEELDYGGSYYEEEARRDVFDILDVLPSALSQAKSSRVGLLALSRQG